MKPTLTTAMRAWLDRETKPATRRVDDIIRAFMRQFATDARTTGKLLGAWITGDRK